MIDNLNGYCRLYCKIKGIPICRKCGERLDIDYKKRKRGKLCLRCLKGNDMECIHHWIIDSSNLGQCKKCDVVKQFPTSPKTNYTRVLSEGRQRHYGIYSGENDNPSEQNAVKILEDLR